jgi:photosystem I P700 chlorophyll a apoprotein A1
MYRTNWGIGHSMKEILEAHKGPFGEGHKGLYEILTTSWHAQLAINLAMLGSLSIVVAHHMYAMPPYPYSNRLCDTTFIIHTICGLDSV